MATGRTNTAKGSPEMRLAALSKASALVASALAATAVMACTGGRAPAEPAPTPDIPGTVQAGVAAALAAVDRIRANDGASPDIAGREQEARILAAVDATLTVALSAAPTPEPAETDTPPATLEPVSVASPSPTSTSLPTATGTPIQPTPTPTPETFGVVLHCVIQSVVKITSDAGAGSGVVIASDPIYGALTILTHAVLAAGLKSVHAQAGETDLGQAEVLGIDLPRGLAVVRTCCVERPSIQISSNGLPGVGAELFALGYPAAEAAGPEWRAVTVQAAEPATVADRVTIVFEMRVEASFQGGPVIDSTGRLMGLVTSDFRPAPDTLAARQASAAIDSATPASRVQPLSAGVRANLPIPGPTGARRYVCQRCWGLYAPGAAWMEGGPFRRRQGSDLGADHRYRNRSRQQDGR